jgi:uncharacterized protein YndB with AHSA1/START domain
MQDRELPRIERNVWLPAVPETVWAHLTEGDLLETWFGGEATITARPGGDIRLDPGAGPVRWGTVEVVEEGSTIQWSWRAGDGDPSLVVIGLEPEEDGTRLTVTETLLDYEMTFAGAFYEPPLRWVG